MRCFSPYYRRLLIPAFAALVAFSGNIALADDNSPVQPAQEDSKKSDQQTDKKDTTAPAAAPSDAPKPEAEPVSTTPAAPPAVATPVYHRLQMRLSGSMCYACLKDLQDALLKIHGIEKVKVDKPQQNYFSAVSPDVSSWANAVVIFDEHVIPLDGVRYAIKTHGYHSYKVVDKLLDHAPDEKDLKLER